MIDQVIESSHTNRMLENRCTEKSLWVCYQN